MSSNIPMTSEEMLVAVFGSTEIDKNFDTENLNAESDVHDPVTALVVKTSGAEVPEIKINLRDLQHADMRPVVIPHRPDLSDGEPTTVESFFTHVKHGCADKMFRTGEAPMAKAASESWDTPLEPEKPVRSEVVVEDGIRIVKFYGASGRLVDERWVPSDKEAA
jgi:hypothetical protein